MRTEPCRKYSKTWVDFRFYRLCEFFRQRLTGLGAPESIVTSSLANLKELKTQERQKFAAKAPSDTGSIRKAVIQAVEELSEEELRRLWLPVGVMLIVCLRSDLQKVRSIVNRRARDDWECDREIQILSVAGALKHGCAELKVKVLRKIASLAPLKSAARVIVGRSTRIALPDEQGDTRDVIPFKSCEDLEKMLPDLLWHCGLDWRSAIQASLQHYYQHRSGRLDQWLRQFVQFEWPESGGKLKSQNKQQFARMGRALLQMLDFWPATLVRDALFSPHDAGDWLNSYDFIVHNDPTKGGSGAVIARLLAKARPDLADKTFPLPKLIENLSQDRQSHRIVFLEDCIMTGDECINLLRHDFKDIASRNSIDFKFAARTSYGTLRLQNYIRASVLVA